MAMNFHKDSYDEATLTKLALFRDYLREWLPVWIQKSTPDRRIYVIDFFAGPGRDNAGQPGSPLIAVEEIERFGDLIQNRRACVHLILNEKVNAKATALRSVLDSEAASVEFCSWEVHSLPFEQAFAQLTPKFSGSPSLVFLDQQGVSFISREVFNELLRLPRTDFLFFIASSAIRRFAEQPEFCDLDVTGASMTGSVFNDTHRRVTDYYRGLAEGDPSFFLGQFSLKKRSNIYGLIFGSHSPRGLEKFLRAAWQADPLGGEANFDIDDDKIDPAQGSLFPTMDQPTKMNAFQAQLRHNLLNGLVKSDADVYLETIKEGFLPEHGKKVVTGLIGDRAIAVEDGKRPRISWAGYQQPRTFRVLKS